MRFSALFSTLAALAPVAFAQDRQVFAHFMNSQLDSGTWSTAISTAKGVGIDGMAINAVPPSAWDGGEAAVTSAYEAGAANGFKFFISFDQNEGYDWDVETVAKWIDDHKDLDAQLKIDGKPVVSTFNGGDWATNWPDVEAVTGDLYIIPAWLNLGAQDSAQYVDLVDGFFNWDAWPAQHGPMTTTGDTDWINAAGEKDYMMGVSPWMYKNLAIGNWFRDSDSLWYDRWEQVLDILPEMVEIITWNDYGESHYIADQSQGTVTEEQSAYVDGIPHTAWTFSLPYYIKAYKAGNRDVTIDTEGAVFWYRTTPKATCSDGGTECQSGSGVSATECTEDVVNVLTLSNTATTVTVSIGGTSKDFDVEKGADFVQMPFDASTLGSVSVSINGKTGSGSVEITNECPAAGRVNFNPVVGSTA